MDSGKTIKVKQNVMQTLNRFALNVPGKFSGTFKTKTTDDGCVKVFVNSGCREHVIYFGDNRIMVNFDKVSQTAPGFFGEVDSLDDLYLMMLNHKLIMD